MSLALASTKSIANEESDEHPFVGSVVLMKGQAAPYLGLLIPDFRVEAIAEDLKLQELAIDELERCLQYRHKMEAEEKRLSRESHFIIGAATATLVVSLILAIKR